MSHATGEIRHDFEHSAAARWHRRFVHRRASDAPTNNKDTHTMVRAKFRCNSVEDQTVNLSPVIGGSEENDQFFKYTPFGEIKIGTINEAALAQFEPGKEYFVDFTPAA